MKSVLCVVVCMGGLVTSIARVSEPPAGLAKVLTMLTDLRAKINMEQEEEAKTYDKFACFCKDTTSSKSAGISSAETQKISLQAELNNAETERAMADMAITEAVAGISKFDAEIQGLTATRHSERIQFEKNEMDLTEAIQALTAAVRELQAAKTAVNSAMLAQLPDVRHALHMAEALNLPIPGHVRHYFSMMQTEPSTNEQAYIFKSEDIITTLENLKTAFKTQKDELDAAEVSAKQLYDSIKQERTESVNQFKQQIETNKQIKAEKTTFITTTSSDITQISSELIEDKKYLAEITSKCSDKKSLWDQRTNLRANEIQALTSALSSLSALSAPPPTLLQVLVQSKATMQNVVRHNVNTLLRRGSPRVNSTLQTQNEKRAPSLAVATIAQRVSEMLLARGQQLNSVTLLHFAREVKEDPLAKVKQLIQELVERLLAQASEEESHKGWCDVEMGRAQQVRDTKATSIRELNNKLELENARKDKLHETSLALDLELSGLLASQDDAATLRDTEKTENERAAQVAKESKVVVDDAIKMLSQFYAAAAKSFLQTGDVADPPIPDAGFDSAYAGAQGGAFGVLGMLEVLASDFERAMTQAQNEEAAAAQQYLEFETATNSLIAAKGEAKKSIDAAFSNADKDCSDDLTTLASEQALLDKALTELIALTKSCVDTGDTAEERKVKRDEEISALKEALAILEGHGSYATLS